MPAESKLTQARLTRLVALHAKGESTRAIAETIGVDHKTVGRWLEERGLKPNGKPGPHRTRSKALAKGDAAAPIGIPDLASSVAKAEAQIEGAGASAGVLRRRLAEIMTLLDHEKKKIEQGTGSITAYKHFTELERTYARELREIEPPQEDDPDKDPTNRAIAARLSDKLAQLVADAERDARCRHCGKAPFR